MEFPNLKHPFSMMICGPSNSGKTFFVRRILETKLIKSCPPKIIWCYGIYQKLFEKMSDIEFHEGIPSGVENVTNALTIIDDLMNELYHPSFMELSKKFVLLPEERLQNFVSEQLSELDEKMQSILRNKNMNDSEKVTLNLQILRKYVNFPFPKEINEDMQEPQKEFENSYAEDLKSVIPNEDSKEALGFIKQETSAENIEQKIEKSAPKKYKTIIKKIILFIQKHREEIYWTPDKELIVDGKIIRNTNVVHLITHLLEIKSP
ncbi:uncharacterized protein TNCV_3252661 [Trichonephila clavipes]|nr:uncharacterized protein TNCV_3252661 [Trichonephila clavipes]